MKALFYISFLMLFILSSCSSALYTGAENDDLYYSASDRPVENERAAVNNPAAEKELKANSYYDNVYAADTLVTDKYSVPSDYDDQIVANNNNPGSMSGNGYDYYDDSYSNRINMFYGNYFNPYWQDPFYFGYGYPYGGLGFGIGFGFGFGFGYGYGYPYYGYGYPYYGYGYGYPYYGYGYPYYGYGYGGYYPYYPYYSDAYHTTTYGRRERASNMSSSWNNNLGTAGTGRRSGTYATASGRSSGSQSTIPESRRGATGVTGGTAVTSQDAARSDVSGSRSATSAAKSQANVKPDYRSANRSYTPSYNNPRMSTRPSYNNSRISGDSPASRSNSAVSQNRTYGNTATVRNSPRYFNQGSASGSGQKSNSFSNMQRKFSSPSGSGSGSRSYSMPSRRSAESSGGGSRSYSSPSSGGSSSGSFSRSSSSGSSGGGSFSGGGGRSSSGGSSHSSGGRR